MMHRVRLGQKSRACSKLRLEQSPGYNCDDIMVSGPPAAVSKVLVHEWGQSAEHPTFVRRVPLQFASLGPGIEEPGTDHNG